MNSKHAFKGKKDISKKKQHFEFILNFFRFHIEKENFFRHQKNFKQLMNQIQKDFDDFDIQVIFEFFKIYLTLDLALIKISLLI